MPSLHSLLLLPLLMGRVGAQCAPGTFFASQCLPCPAGHFCPGGTPAPALPCVPATACPEPGLAAQPACLWNVTSIVNFVGSGPQGLALDPAGNAYVANPYIYRVSMWNATTGAVKQVAGTGAAGYTNGVGTSSALNQPQAVACDGFGSLYIAEPFGVHRIRRLNTSTGILSPFVGFGSAGFADGVGSSARFSNPYQIASDMVAGNVGNLYVADADNVRGVRASLPSLAHRSCYS